METAKQIRLTKPMKGIKTQLGNQAYKAELGNVEDPKKREKMLVTKLGLFEDLMEDYKISSVAELATILHEFHADNMLTMLATEFLSKKGLSQEFSAYVENKLR